MEYKKVIHLLLFGCCTGSLFASVLRLAAGRVVGRAGAAAAAFLAAAAASSAAHNSLNSALAATATAFISSSKASSVSPHSCSVKMNRIFVF